MKPDNPHDRFFKKVYSRKENAAAHLRAFLPPHLLEVVDLDTLAHCPGSFVDDGLKERHTDVLFKARIGGALVYIYILLEHQSGQDPQMPLRILDYVLRIWRDWQGDNPGIHTLPPVLPFILYQGGAPWTAPVQLLDMIDAPPGAVAALKPHLPVMESVLMDLTRYSDAELKAGAWFGLALLLLKHARDGDLLERFAGWVDLVGRLRREAPDGLNAVRLLLKYRFSASSAVEPERVVPLLALCWAPRPERWS